MLSFYIIFSVCLVTYAVNADNSAPENDNVPVITSRGIQKPKQTERGNIFTASNYRGLGLSANRSKLSNSTKYNNSNYTNHTTYVQGSVHLDLKDDAVSINGKKVPGFKANDVKVVEWGKGSLKVNGIRQERFNGIRGEGIINLGTENTQAFWDDDESDESNSSISDESSEEDSDSDSEEEYWPIGNKKKDSQKKILNVHTGRPVPNQGYGNRNGYGFGGYGNNRYAQGLPYNIPQRYDYQSRYQNRGRPFAMSSPPINNGNRMNYGNVMDRYKNNNSFNSGYNNKHRSDNITKIGGQGYSEGIMIDGKRIERTADGLIINGRKVPGVNAYDSIEIDWNQKGGIVVNGEKKAGFKDIKGIGKTQFKSKLNPTYNDSIGSSHSSAADKKSQNKKGPNVSLQNGQVVINGKKIPLDIGNLNLVVNDEGVVINGEKIPVDELENPLHKAYVGGSEIKQDMTSDGINGKEVTKNVIGQKGIIVDRTDDGLLVNGKKVPGVNANDRVVIDYDEEGITVNGVKKEGFKGIKGKGRRVMGSRLNPTHLDAVQSTTDNNIQNSKSRKGGQQRNRQKQQQVIN